jgi:hypothetical protein
MYGKYRDKLVNALRGKLPSWQRAAAVRQDGTTNDKAVIAGDVATPVVRVTKRHRRLVIFLPLEPTGRGSIPVRLTKVDRTGRFRLHDDHPDDRPSTTDDDRPHQRTSRPDRDGAESVARCSHAG